MLKPALVPMWRSKDALQLGLGPGLARVVEGLDANARAVLALLDGSHDLEQVRALAGAAGVPREQVDELVGALDRCGLLADAASDGERLRGLDPQLRADLDPELSALSLLRPAPGAAAAALHQRRTARVALAGAPSIVGPLGDLLEASGVAPPARYTLVAELAPDTVGRRAPDLVVLAAVGVLDLDSLAWLEHLSIPHLFAGVRELTGVVGPLVLPGRTSCLHCQQLQRTDREPRWPALALQYAQVTAGARGPATLAALVAATAAVQALTYLDGERPDTIEGSLEVTLPDWRFRRRSWRRHPECPCSLPATG